MDKKLRFYNYFCKKEAVYCTKEEVVTTPNLSIWWMLL